MSRKGPLVLALVVVGIFLFAITLIAGLYLISGGTENVEEGTVVRIVLGGGLRDLPTENPLAQIFESGALNLWDLGKVFRYAAGDDRISAIYMEIHPLLLSWAQIEELREHIKNFREAGKPVHAFLAVDMVRDPEMYLAAAADSITLNPDAGMLVNGLVAEVLFFKGAMDKLGVRPEFIQFKEYKSAESYSRESMTPQIREMYESILGDIEQRFVTAVAGDRSTDEAGLRRLMEAGVSPATRGLEENLVDTLGYRTEVLETLLERDDSDEDSPLIQASGYLGLVEEEFRTRSRHKVALIGGFGPITSGRSDPFSEMMGGSTLASHLRKIRKDENLKGIIFRVDSPGGSAVGSDMVWNEVRLLEEENKPVVVSMSGVAGSGGYYISMGARHIVSQPSTITGSIGVIFGKFDMRELYDWLGISVDRVKLSPSADILSPFGSLSQQQRESVESWMETIYENFVRKAAEGRGLQYEDLESKARGRIYTGLQAKELGLVDRLGGLEAAVAQMKETLELEEGEEIELVLYPRPRSLWDRLASGDLLAGEQPFSPIGQWVKDFGTFAHPKPWMLTPEINIY